MTAPDLDLLTGLMAEFEHGHGGGENPFDAENMSEEWWMDYVGAVMAFGHGTAQDTPDLTNDPSHHLDSIVGAAILKGIWLGYEYALRANDAG